jgi:hypothetical protein
MAKRVSKTPISFRIPPLLMNEVDDLYVRINKQLREDHLPQFESRASLIRTLLDIGLKRLEANFTGSPKVK